MNKFRHGDRNLAICLIITLLVGTYVAPTRAFTNGQNPSIVIGQTNSTSIECATTQSGLCGPNDVAFDSSGNMWVTDHLNHRVIEFNPPFSNGMNASIVIGQRSFTKSDSTFSQSGFGPAGHYGPQSSLFDSSGDLWVVGFSRVLEFKPPFSSGMSASLVVGQKDFTSQDTVGLWPCSRAQLGYPNWGAFDSSGNLWVADTLSNRVLEFSPPFSIGMNASLVIGQKDFAHCGPGLSQSGLDTLFGSIAFDQSGDLWVGDANNDRVLEFHPPFSNGMNASLVLGQKDFVTGHVPPNLGNHEEFISFDGAGNFWLSRNNTVSEFKPPFVSGTTFSQGLLEIGSQSGLSDQSVPAFDSKSNLWLSDFGNNRVLEFEAGSTTSITSATSTVTSNQAAGGISTRLVVVGLVVLVLAIIAAAVALGRRRSVRA